MLKIDYLSKNKPPEKANEYVYLYFKMYEVMNMSFKDNKVFSKSQIITFEKMIDNFYSEPRWDEDHFSFLINNLSISAELDNEEQCVKAIDYFDEYCDWFSTFPCYPKRFWILLDSLKKDLEDIGDEYGLFRERIQKFINKYDK